MSLDGYWEARAGLADGGRASRRPPAVARRRRLGRFAMQWAVAHRVRLGGRSALAPRLVITDVPEVGRATLRSAPGGGWVRRKPFRSRGSLCQPLPPPPGPVA